MTSKQIEALGRRIKERRESAGLSLNALASAASVSKGYLSELERGTASNPGLDVLRRLADALSTPLPALLEEGESAAPPTSPPIPPSLREFHRKKAAEGDPIPDEAMDILARMCRRGGPARTADDWAYLFEFLRRNVL